MNLGEHLKGSEPIGTYEAPPHGWTCFHCGETFKREGHARLHFGETPEETPACVLKIQVGGERGLIMELRKAQSLARRLQSKVETLEYQQYVDAENWSRITGLRRGYDARMEMDSLEGRALAAEAVVADIKERWPALVAAANSRVCQRPKPKQS